MAKHCTNLLNTIPVRITFWSHLGSVGVQEETCAKSLYSRSHSWEKIITSAGEESKVFLVKTCDIVMYKLSYFSCIKKLIVYILWFQVLTHSLSHVQMLQPF